MSYIRGIKQCYASGECTIRPRPRPRPPKTQTKPPPCPFVIRHCLSPLLILHFEFLVFSFSFRPLPPPPPPIPPPTNNSRPTTGYGPRTTDHQHPTCLLLLLTGSDVAGLNDWR